MQVGDIKFKTKKLCEAYTRMIINKGCRKITEDEEDFKYLMDLIKSSSTAEGRIKCGIKEFQITPIYLCSSPKLTLLRVDGSEDAVSWKDLSNGRVKTSRDKLIMAMRDAVKDKSIQFKKDSKIQCSLCLVDNLPYDKYDVDHKDTPFSKIRDDFLGLTTHEIPEDFDKNPTTCVRIFKAEDAGFANAWIEYHDSLCDYQILCKTCNVKKGNRKIVSMEL